MALAATLVWGAMALPDHPVSQEPRPVTAAVLSLPDCYNPRDAACDLDGRIYVLDRRARIFVLDTAGTLRRILSMPASANGNPQGICPGPGGELYVADTHYHRVLVFDPQGRPARQWGSYGRGPGQFVYITSVCVSPDGERVYAAEYGGNDRIQIFDPNGVRLGSIGRRGAAQGEFDRPSGLALDRQGHLYVADACNHRVQVFDPQGRFLRSLGEAPGPGRLRYPWDVDVTPQGTVAVLEYGNHCVTFFDRDGTVLGSQGGPGRTPGRLLGPWGLAVGPDGRIFVADTGNNRVQAFGPLGALAAGVTLTRTTHPTFQAPK